MVALFSGKNKVIKDIISEVAIMEFMENTLLYSTGLKSHKMKYP